MDGKHEIVELASRLIERASVTPDDAGCQGLIGEALERQGFTLTHLPSADVSNLWAVHGDGEPMVVFAGHTDVVPTGPVTAWRFDPFTPTIADGCLYGRGAADMKGSLAAMLVATGRFIDQYPEHEGSIAYLITSDEEGPAVDGTVKVVEWLADQGIRPRYCVVGEPSSTDTVGDVIRIGRRGSLNGRLTIHGVQGHVAYPQRAKNPLHAVAPALAALVAEQWDEGNAFFPPTSFQIANLNMGTGADNVIPGTLTAQFNLRFSTELDAATIKRRVHAILDQCRVDYEIDWRLSGVPFLTPAGALIGAACDAVRDIIGCDPELSTAGGTSDGRFIAPTGAQVLELGPVNATIHQIDECVGVDELDTLSAIYQRVLERLLVRA